MNATAHNELDPTSSPCKPRWKSAGRRAFSLPELLVAVALLSILILALYAMFDQTQKALRASVGQVDVMEGTRAAMELMVRDLEHARPAGIDLGPHLITRMAVEPGLILQQAALFQDRQPALQQVFALKNIGDHRWQVFGYFLGNEQDPRLPMTPPIGTLYRYEDRVVTGRPTGSPADAELIPFETVAPGTPLVEFSTRTALPAQILVRNLIQLPFANAQMFRSPTNAARILDGVINFRVTPHDEFGRPYRLHSNPIWSYPLTELPPAWQPRGTPPGWAFAFTPVDLRSVAGGFLTETTFSGPAMPVYLDVEVDALEPRLLEQYHALPANPQIRNRFLTNNLSRVMSFRQRIPLRASLR